MKKLYIVLLTMILTVSSIFAFDNSWLTEIEFENNTGEEIYYLFVTPSESEMWGPDILGYTESFYSSDRMVFNAYYPESTQYFDIKAITISGEIYVYYEFRVSDDVKLNKFVIDSEIWEDTTDMEALYDDFHTLTITNETGYDLTSLFISPGDADAYGIDFLSNLDYLYADEEFSVYLLMSGSTRDYHIYAVDSDEDTYTFSLELNPKLDENFTAVEMSDLD